MHTIKTDVLIIGAGGAGMYAAISAARAGAQVLLVDRNMIGRGGATVMAQMTVAAALAAQEPDDWERHLQDTLEAGRGMCDQALSAEVCKMAPARIRELAGWGVGWAKDGARIRQVHAPGHGVQRCCYVDFLNTGPAIAGTLRKIVGRTGNIRRLSDVQVTNLAVDSSSGVLGAHAFHHRDGQPVSISAGASIIATGGLTGLYSRTSASNNMGGDGYALALEAGADLIDMEFVQFFPIGHLAPRLVGMDPIMWDPFRYKLGGRLLNGQMEEFIEAYGGEDEGRYRATRDVATFAICREVEAGRGTPNGGAYLSFAHLSERDLRSAFGPVIDRLANNGIDLTTAPVEVAPIAHYHMGGIRVNKHMHSNIPGLLAAGEAVGGAGGANRLSGNAITEALVFGEIAGRSAAATAVQNRRQPTPTRFDDHDASKPQAKSTLSRIRTLRDLMWSNVGPFRTHTGLQEALRWIHQERAAHDGTTPPLPTPFSNELAVWHDFRHGLLVADAVATAAIARQESRGAHQRDDYPETDSAHAHNATVTFTDGAIQLATVT